MRDRHGGTSFAGGTLRAPGGAVRVLRPPEIVFTATRRWRSPRTGIEYPLGWHVRAGERDFALEPLMDDQESDTRMSTGAIYWEGAVRAREAGRDVGRGYLELTGYGEALQLR
jgi:predicted secreted hydrolase